MKFRFTPEMFPMEFFVSHSEQYNAVSLANKELDKHLATLPRVYGYADRIKNGEIQMFTEVAPLDVTHKAYLFDVEELPKKECEHEPVKLELRVGYEGYCLSGASGSHMKYESPPVPMFRYECSKCGVRLKAKWEAE